MARRHKKFEEHQIPIDFLKVLNCAPDPILVITATEVVLANKSAIKLFGAKNPQELIGKPIIAFIHPDYRELAAKRIERVLKQGKSARIAEERILKIDGSTLDVEVSAKPIAKNRMIVVSLHDISERKKAEEDLRKSEQRFRIIYEKAPIAKAILRLDGSFIGVNESFSKMFGYSKQEMLTKNIKDVTYPEDIPASNKAFKEYVKQEVPTLDIEKRYLSKEGKLVWGHVRANLVLDAQKKPVYSIAQIEDITERKKTEQALKESEERYRSLMESAHDAIFLADAETGILIDANKRAEELIGKPLEQIIGMHQMKLHPPEKAEEYREVFKEFTAAGGGTTPQLLVQHSSGRKVPIEISANVVDVGERKILQGIFRDITERTRAKALSDTLNDINTAIHSTLNFEQIMQRVIIDSVKGIEADAASISMREDEYWSTRYVYNLGQELTKPRIQHKDATFMRLASDSRETIYVADTYKDERVDNNFMKKHGIRSLLSVPLIVKDNVVGVISFFYKSKAATFSEDEIDFANKVAASISLAIENAGFYEAERSIADTLQESLLAIPKKINGLDFSHLYRSATEVARVGGDFYDLFEIEHGKIGMIIGDVSGKGIEATSYASLIKNTVKAYAFQDQSPASIMNKANKLAVKSTDPHTFVTVFFGILDANKNQIIYCNAGHPPPILQSAGAKTGPLIPNSPIIGILEDLDYKNDKTNFSGNDTLVFYTDGVTETRNDGDLFGDRRFIRLIDDLKKIPTNQKASSIFNAIISFSKGKLTDDLALLVMSPKNKQQ